MLSSPPVEFHFLFWGIRDGDWAFRIWSLSAPKEVTFRFLGRVSQTSNLKWPILNRTPCPISLLRLFIFVFVKLKLQEIDEAEFSGEYFIDQKCNWLGFLVVVTCLCLSVFTLVYGLPSDLMLTLYFVTIDCVIYVSINVLISLTFWSFTNKLLLFSGVPSVADNEVKNWKTKVKKKIQNLNRIRIICESNSLTWYFKPSQQSAVCDQIW